MGSQPLQEETVGGTAAMTNETTSDERFTRRRLLETSAAVVAAGVVEGCAAERPAPASTTTTHTPDRPAEGAHAHGASHDGGHHDPNRWLETLDDPARDAWQKPREVVSAMAISEGMVIADIGAGTGYFEPHLSRAVGARGRVLALDISPELVAHMRRRFGESGLTNVEARLVSPADPGLATGSIDRVLIVDTWHHITDRVEYARKLLKALAPTGRIVIVDYPVDAPTGPPPELRVSERQVVAELEAAGFRARIEPDALERQYVVVGEG